MQEKDELYTNEQPAGTPILEMASDPEKLNYTQRQTLATKLGKKAEDENIAPKADVEYIYDKILTMEMHEALEVLDAAIDYHSADNNFPRDMYKKIKLLVQGHEAADLPLDEWEFDCKAEAAIIKYHSPYPEVRAIADPFDNPDEPVETIRSYFLAMMWAIVGMGINTFFAPRFPTITFSTQVIQLLLYPCGKFCEFVLPDWGFTMFGSRHSLNPGPWSYKEQMFATISFSVCLTTIYVYWNFQVQRLDVYFDGDWVTVGYEILLTLSNQCMGFGFAGLLRRFAIYPAKAIWPSILPTVALSRALLVPDKKEESVHGWTMTRYKFFFITLGGSFLWYWIPGFLFQGLSVFSWMSWIKPDNFTLSMITGSQSGLGLNPINSFDFLPINQLTPFQAPFFAFFQQSIGTVLAFFVILAIWYTGRRWTQYMPVNTSQIYANDGQPFQVTKVLNPDGTFNVDKYRDYSPPYYSAGNLVVYGAFFAFYPLNVFYMFIDQWKLARDAFVGLYKDMVFDLKNIGVRGGKMLVHAVRFDFAGVKKAFNAPGPTRPSVYSGYQDAHTTMMMQYPEVPDWWFLCIFLLSFVFGVLCIAIYPINTPVWVLFFVVGINAAYIVPMSMIYAATGMTEGLNVLTELIIGFALQGNAQALMFGKAFGYNISGQADNYVSSQKMGIYAKIPPRAIFRGQVIATILACFASIGVMEWQFSNIEGLCHPDQPQNFNCANGSQVYYAAAVMWGSIGPQRVFSQLYPELQWCFLVGFVAAILFLVGQKHGHTIRAWFHRVLSGGAAFTVLDKTLFNMFRPLKYVNPVVVCNGFLQWAPLNLTYMFNGMFISYFFHRLVKTRYTAWWEKYVYVLASGLIAGTTFSAIIVFFATGYNPVSVNWWGNEIVGEGVDALGPAMKTLPEGEIFGLQKGEFY